MNLSRIPNQLGENHGDTHPVGESFLFRNLEPKYSVLWFGRPEMQLGYINCELIANPAYAKSHISFYYFSNQKLPWEESIWLDVDGLIETAGLRPR